MRKSIIFSILAFLCACRAEPPVAPHMGVLPLSIGPGVHILASKDTLAGIMQSMNRVAENPSRGGSSGTAFNTSAVFFNSVWRNAEAGGVQLNGISIPWTSGVYATFSTQTFGISHHWQITANGSGTVPTINDSIQAPPLFHITYPASISDTISTGAGFTCTYDNPGTDSVTIILDYDSAATRAFYDTSIHNAQVAPVSKTVANTGSYFVSSSLLSSLPNSGVMKVWVVAYRSKVVTASGRHYLIAATSRAQSWCAIKSQP